jgi:hypothetical protein
MARTQPYHSSKAWLKDVSVVRNYRTQFNRILERSSFEGLIEAMEQKLAQLQTPPGHGQ